MAISKMKNRRLVDILNGESREDLARRFEETEAAPEYAPLPKGVYVAELSSAELTSSTTGTPGYTLGFTVNEGDLKGRRVWHTLWLTPAAMPMTKRDLAKLGVVKLDQLERPVPPGIICQLTVVVRTDDDGETRNRVTRYEVIEIRPDSTADDDFGVAGSGAGEGGAA
jgi:hypothetical protein